MIENLRQRSFENDLSVVVLLTERELSVKKTITALLGGYIYIYICKINTQNYQFAELLHAAVRTN